MTRLIAILALALAALAVPAYATATWQHFGADKAYPNREAAVADTPRVLRQAGYPGQVVALLTEAMKSPGIRTHVTNGMKFDFMRSGTSALWRNVEVKFDKPPFAESMEYSAPAEEWSVEFNGTTWTAGIPDVCNNVYGKRVVASAPLPNPASVSALASKPALATKSSSRECPDGWMLTVFAWSLSAMSDDLRKEVERHIAAAKKRDSQEGESLEVFRSEAVSRTLGSRLLEEVKKPAPVTADIMIRYADRDSETRKLRHQEVGTLKMVNGRGQFIFAEDPRQHHVIGVIFPKEDFRSPELSGPAKQLERRIRIHAEEWTGCRLFVSGVVE